MTKEFPISLCESLVCDEAPGGSAWGHQVSDLRHGNGCSSACWQLRRRQVSVLGDCDGFTWVACLLHSHGAACGQTGSDACRRASHST